MSSTAQQIKALEANGYRIVRLAENDRSNRPWYALLLDDVEVDRGSKSTLAMMASAGIDSPFHALHAKYAARVAAARTAAPSSTAGTVLRSSTTDDVRYEAEVEYRDGTLSIHAAQDADAARRLAGELASAAPHLVVRAVKRTVVRQTTVTAL